MNYIVKKTIPASFFLSKVRTVPFMVGYGSLAAFSNVFYQVAGIRPTDYAKMLHKK